MTEQAGEQTAWLLRDGEGNVYLVPSETLAACRVPADQQAELQAAAGEDVSGFIFGPRGGEGFGIQPQHVGLFALVLVGGLVPLGPGGFGRGRGPVA